LRCSMIARLEQPPEAWASEQSERLASWSGRSARSASRRRERSSIDFSEPDSGSARRLSGKLCASQRKSHRSRRLATGHWRLSDQAQDYRRSGREGAHRTRDRTEPEPPRPPPGARKAPESASLADLTPQESHADLSLATVLWASPFGRRDRRWLQRWLGLCPARSVIASARRLARAGAARPRSGPHRGSAAGQALQPDARPRTAPQLRHRPSA